MSKIGQKIICGLKNLTKKVTVTSLPKKDIKQFVKTMPTISEVCGKDASKAVINQVKAAKNLDKGVVKNILGKSTAQNAAQQYAAVKADFQAYGVPVPKILNNKMSVGERIQYLRECFNARQQRRDSLSKAFLGVDYPWSRFMVS